MTLQIMAFKPNRETVFSSGQSDSHVIKERPTLFSVSYELRSYKHSQQVTCSSVLDCHGSVNYY
jgi:hypothetical protein